MNISLNIEAGSPEEILAAIKELAAAGVVHTSAKQGDAEPKKNTSPRSNKPTTPKNPELEQTTDTTQNNDADTTPPAEETAEIPSVTEIKEAAVEKGKTPEGKAAIKKLLSEFESSSISAIPEDKRAAFLAALRDL